ncbi:uncharacterized protein [Palaemon carinicauda]|uniref:uncharacterized protein n=1 Tax=Palaemon carinicauda TaxID=392227 RepID=UPI0035B5FE92
MASFRRRGLSLDQLDTKDYEKKQAEIDELIRENQRLREDGRREKERADALEEQLSRKSMHLSLAQTLIQNLKSEIAELDKDDSSKSELMERKLAEANLKIESLEKELRNRRSVEEAMNTNRLRKSRDEISLLKEKIISNASFRPGGNAICVGAVSTRERKKNLLRGISSRYDKEKEKDAGDEGRCRHAA